MIEECSGYCIYNNCTGQHFKLPFFGIIKGKFVPPKFVPSCTTCENQWQINVPIVL